MVNITQSMDISLIDGYKMNLVCTVSTNIETNVAIHWRGVGPKSMWVHQSSVSQKANKYSRQLLFRPWLDVHAGEYTCMVMMDDTQCKVEKSISVESTFCMCNRITVIEHCYCVFYQVVIVV